MLRAQLQIRVNELFETLHSEFALAGYWQHGQIGKCRFQSLSAEIQTFIVSFAFFGAVVDHGDVVSHVCKLCLCCVRLQHRTIVVGRMVGDDSDIERMTGHVVFLSFQAHSFVGFIVQSPNCLCRTHAIAALMSYR